MRKSIITIIIVLALTGILLMRGCSTYNTMVSLDEQVSKSWADVEAVYQRRLDLVNAIVGTVKGSANFEQSTLEGVINARAKATSITIDPSRMSAEQMAQFQAAQGELSSALARLMVVFERYPDLKTTAQFQDLVAELAGSENRIAQERRVYNDIVAQYNAYIRRFPQNMFAGMFGFERRASFSAESGAEKGVVPDFGDFGNGNKQQ